MRQKAMRFLLACAVVCAACSGWAGNVCTWTGAGADGRIQTAANWDVAPVNGNGDTLVFDNAGEVVNDVADFAVGRVEFRGAATTTVKGARLSLGTRPAEANETVLPWTNACPVVCEAPLLFHNRYWSHVVVTLGADVDFNGDIEIEYSQTASESSAAQRANYGFRVDTVPRKNIRCVFRGNLASPGHAILFNPCSNANVTQSGFWVYGDVTARTVGSRTDGQESGYVHFLGKVTCEELVACYRHFVFEGDNLLAPGARMSWANWYEYGEIDLNGHDQTCGSLGCESWNGAERGGRDRIVTSAAPATLTVAGTADGTTYAQVCGRASILYAPASATAVQTFARRAHATQGGLTVANGTVRLAEGCSWPNLTRLSVRTGATLEIAEANGKADPFGSLYRLGVAAGGRVRIPAGVSFMAPVVAYGETFYAAGAVLSGVAGDGVTAVPWIDGAGTVTVSARSDCSFWVGGSGDWSDVAHWIGGVPAAGGTAVVDGDGTDFTVAVGAADALPAKLTVGNAGGVATVRLAGKTAAWNPESVELNGGGRLELADGTAITTTGGAYAVNAGGELRLAGGTFSANAFTGTFAVSGSSSSTGRVTLAGGTFAYGVTATWQGSTASMLQVRTGGEIRATGGTLEILPSTGANYVRGLHQCGGRLAVSGPAAVTCGSSAKGAGPFFGTGESVFDGAAQLRNKYSGERLTVSPSAAGETARLVLRDQAVLAGENYDSLIVGETAGGTGVVELDSDVVHVSQLGYRVNVGAQSAYGEFIMRRGHARTNYRGFLIGGSQGNAWGRDYTTTGGRGVFRMSGGALHVQGSQISTEHIFPGFCVGEGSQVKASGKNLYTGLAEVSGGVITNYIGFTAIGGARSVGAYVQTGGLFLHRNYWGLPQQNYMVGFAGGTGSVTLGGGEILVYSDCYVGGCPTNCIGGGYNLSIDYPYPEDEHDAVGVLTVTGGVFRTTKRLLLGQDGDGTLAVAGTRGTVRIDGALICSNCVMGAGTATARQTRSTLAFTLDAAGVSPVTAASADLTPGTCVTVDFTAYAGKATRFKLVDAPVSGAVADLDAVFADASGRRRDGSARLLAKSDGLYVTVTSRTLLVIR